MAKKSPKKLASTRRKTAAGKSPPTKKAAGKAAARSPSRPFAKPSAKPASENPSRTPAAAAAKATAKAPSGSGLSEGAKAPNFSLPRDGGATVSLKDFEGRKLVIYFYPRADTPGCTREAMDFTRLRHEFAKAGAAVIGVSADPPKAQDAFRAKYDLAIALASDEARSTIEAYGAWGEKSMYGRTFQGILRTTVLIGANGRIARIWRNVRVDGHADDVLEAARELPES